MKLFHIMVATIAVLATIFGASAIQVRYSGISSTPFGSDGYGMVSVTERGVGSYGATWSPDGIAGGYSARGDSMGFGYSYATGMRNIGVNAGTLRGTWTRGYDGQSYGGFAAGPGRFSTGNFGYAGSNAWGSYATSYSQYGSNWGNGYSPYSYQ